MDLIEILNNILVTKNEIRDILGENNNIARYSIAIHNLLARQYNAGYRQAFHDRYYELTGIDRWLAGPQEILEYDINPQYYEAFTTEILTDIMRDVLNYRLNIKDELNYYIEPDIDDNFKEYPEYLNGILETIISIGVEDGIKDGDDAYEGSADVDVPTFNYTSNTFTINTSQSDALIYYSLGENGIQTIYTGPVILSEPVDVYYWAKIGKSESSRDTHVSCTVSSDGNVAFVWPPTVLQQDNKIYMSSTSNGSIQYSIDGGEWRVYYGPVLVQSGMQEVKAMCVKDNEYSKYTIQPLSFQPYIDQYRPDNVRCTIVDDGSYRTVTLTCATAGANIYYAIDEADGYYRNYNGPFTLEANHFLVYTYARKDGYESKLRLVYKWDISEDITIPEDVQFLDEGSAITLYTTTPNARVNYRFGPVGSFTESTTNAISLNPTDKTDIYAYSTLNGINSRNESRYTFTPSGVTTRPPQPVLVQQGNTILISSPYEVRYTMNMSDPRAYGIIYNPNKGIEITESTTIKAVAILNGVYSNITTASYRYDDSSVGGESGSTGGGGGVNPTNGTDTGEPFIAGNWFYVKGATGLTFRGSEVYFASDGDRTWKTVATTSISGLNPDVKTYFKGNVSAISAFAGEASIGGDISSIRGGVIGEADKMYTRMFNNCSGLVNATNLIINISSMPDSMLEGMFMGCTDLREAAFELNTNVISNNGMQNMFNGCSNLLIGPSFYINDIGVNGMFRAFYGCSKLTSGGRFILMNVNTSALNSCYYGCSELVSVSLNTSDGTAPDNIFNSMFYNCSSLSEVSSISINYGTMGVSSCNSMFYGCTAMRIPVSLPATVSAPSCYAHMYENSGITNPPVINMNNVTNSCCDSMFKNCVNLGSSPDLNVENLFGAGSCYKEMFYGCSSLNHIKALFYTNPGEHTANWVYGVPSGGTFEASNEANWPNGSAAFGPNAVPDGWTIVGAATIGTISDIWQQDGIVHIESRSSDEIWYQITNSSAVPPEDAFVKYTGPFQLYETKWVHARCKNEDGIFGTVYSEEISPAYPKLSIIQRSGTITIKTETDFEYDYITYQICEFQDTSTVLQDFRTYSAPFAINDDVTIVAKGYINSKEATSTVYDVVFGASSPAIEFYVTYNGDHSAILKIRCAITYPGSANSLWYKINDREEDNPDTNPSAWTRYTSAFEVTSYLDSTHDRVSVTAIANITYKGNDIWTTMNVQDMYKGTSEQLSDPVFVQLVNSNDVILQYNEQQYYTWDDTDVVIEYKYNIGGATLQYKRQFNLSESGAYSEQDVNVYGRARIGNIMTEWKNNVLHYNPSYLHFDVDAPSIDVRIDGSNIKVYVTNSTTQPAYYSVENYFKITVVEYDATGLRPEGTVYSAFYPYTQPFVISEHAVKFYVEAYSKINNDISDTTTSKTYDIKTDFGIMWDERPVPTISINNTNYKVTITCPYDIVPLIKVVDTQWGTGAVDESKYNTYKYATAVGFGNVSTGVYEGYLDEHLASGTIYVKYEYEGIESSEASCAYKNNSVQALVAPKISCSWDMNKQAYILKLSNTSNPGVTLRYKMTDCVWSGGVVDEHKYDDYRVCGLYGDTISEYLISATIIGQTYYSSTPPQTRESTYAFVNEHYEQLPVPQIFIVEKTYNNAIKVTNKNKNATNYWRVKSGTGVWNPSAVNPHKYDNWTTAFITDNDLDNYLLSGTFQAYSVWGHENTLDELVEYVYDTGITINDTPPTVTVTQGNDLYNITITNNADASNFFNLKWKVDDIYWNNAEEVDCFESRYKKDIGDRFKIENRANTFTFTIGKDVLSGTIQAYYTDETDNVSTGNRTPMTVVEFTNQLIQS